MSSQPEPRILFTVDEIEATVKRLAGEISQDYHDKRPLLIGVLKGSFMFMADLIRHLDFPLEVLLLLMNNAGDDRISGGGEGDKDDAVIDSPYTRTEMGQTIDFYLG